MNARDFLNGVWEFYRWLFGPIIQLYSKVRAQFARAPDGPSDQPSTVSSEPPGDGEEAEQLVQVDLVVGQQPPNFLLWLVLGLWRLATMPFRWVYRLLVPYNPLKFQPDLWDLEGDERMAMDVRPEIIVLPKPWGLLLWPTGRKVVGITLIEVFSLRMWINVETKTLWMSTSWVRGTIGNSYGVELIEIQVPEQVKYPGIFPEVLLNLSGVQFSIKGSGATKTEMRVVPLPRRGMWWPENIHRPRKGAKSRAGAAYVLAFKSLSKWANTGQWT